ncbi:MAG: hypothetical protein JXB44_05630 [Calditrichaceae bacterium]|nr:hypothetical protein [Calditrichaceae bacterium]
MGSNKITENISYYANLANKILTSKIEGEQYLDDKEIISILYTSTEWKLQNYKNNKDRQKLKIRLTLVDSYYSTNVASKRYNGINDIIDRICMISNSDNELIDKFKMFLDDIKETNEIGQLFNGLYGWTKTHSDGLKAISLISKFAYFLTEFSFPIIDKYVSSYHTRLFKEFKKNDDFSTKELPKNNSDLSIFRRIKVLNKPIQNFDKLDNLLWLIGKLANNNFSLILNKKVHKTFFNKIEKKPGKILSKIIYRDDILNWNIFSEPMIEFIKFVKILIPEER